MRDYELVVVLSPMLNQEEISGTWERIKGLITGSGGNIAHEEQWGMRRLAYSIRKASQKFSEGNYLLAHFSMDEKSAGELERFLRLTENVLRFLLIKREIAQPVAARSQESNEQEVRNGGTE